MKSENLENFVKIKSRTISCQGSDDDNSGHPKIWLKIPYEEHSIKCPYCEKKFVLSL